MNAKKLLGALLLTALMAVPLAPAQVNAQDSDNDGVATATEAKIGSHPLRYASQPGSDDDGDGRINAYEVPEAYDYAPAQCTGAYGYVRAGICNGYTEPTGTPRQGETVWRDSAGLLWAWDAVCLPAALDGDYATCKATGNRQLSAAIYGGDWTSDGYGWRHLDATATSVEAYTACGVEDADGDDVPTLHVCTTTYTVATDGSLHQGESEPWMDLGDTDAPQPGGLPSAGMVYLPTTPGQPMAVEASEFAAAFNEVFLLVDPAGHLSIAPGTVLPLDFTVVVRFMHPPGVNSIASEGATLQIVDAAGAVVFASLAYPQGSSTSVSDFYVQFRSVPPVKGVDYVLGYAGHELRFKPLIGELAEVSGQPCDYADVPQQCSPLPTTCDVLSNVPFICGPAIQICEQPVVENYPPCDEAPRICDGAVSIDCVCDAVEGIGIELTPCGGEGCLKLRDCLGCDPSPTAETEPCLEGCDGHPVTEIDQCYGIITLLCNNLTDLDCLLCQDHTASTEASEAGLGYDCLPTVCETVWSCLGCESSRDCELQSCTNQAQPAYQNPGVPVCLFTRSGSSNPGPRSNQDCAAFHFLKDNDHSEAFLETEETRTVGVNYTLGHHYDYYRFSDTCAQDSDQYNGGLAYAWHGSALVAGGTEFDVSWNVVAEGTRNNIGFKPLIYYGPVSAANVRINDAYAVGRRVTGCDESGHWPPGIFFDIAGLLEAPWAKAFSFLSLVPDAIEFYCGLTEKEHWAPFTKTGPSEGGADPDNYQNGLGIRMMDITDGTNKAEYGGEIDLTALQGGSYFMDLTSASIVYVSWHSTSGDSVNARLLTGEQHVAPRGCVAGNDGRCPGSA